MTITLIAALDGSGNIVSNANTYGTLAEADAYFAARPNSTAWTGEADDDVRSGWLLWGMKSLKGLRYIGGRLTQTQPLDWPRVAIRPIERNFEGLQYGGGYGAGLFDQSGLWIPSNMIPDNLKAAQFEFAFAVQQSTVATSADLYKRRIITNSKGTLEFKTGTEQQTALNALAMRELRGLLLGAHEIARA